MNIGEIATALMCLLVAGLALSVPVSVARHNRRERLKADKRLKDELKHGK